MRRTTIALVSVALLAVPASAETLNILIPPSGPTKPTTLDGKRIKKITIEGSSDATVVRIEFKKSLADKLKGGAKKVGGGAKHCVQSTAGAAGHGLKAAGHGIVVLNEKAKPVTAVVSTVATWAGAWYFLKGRGVI